MLSYGKQHKKVKRIKSSRLYILPYKNYIFQRKEKNEIFFPRT